MPTYRRFEGGVLFLQVSRGMGKRLEVFRNGNIPSRTGFLSSCGGLFERKSLKRDDLLPQSDRVSPGTDEYLSAVQHERATIPAQLRLSLVMKLPESKFRKRQTYAATRR